ncbi:MAG: 4'-phosphopantetheinyl transferase superfamily protein [Deltaproteobacteria bacterium]|nr:4'-phosphopantetheinyl transferase superfamily protein [Deltaproteobacteria bacterium]
MPRKISVKRNHADVWSVSLEADKGSLESFQECLSEDERNKIKRLRFEKARNNFIVARYYLRVIVAPYLNTKPEDLEFQYGPYGKPALSGKFENTGTCFNMSHSHGLALYAVTSGQAVGVDIEKVRPDPDCIKIAERYFSPQEVEALRKLPKDQQRQGFFNCWTRKEAYLKAKGEGFSSPADQFQVSLTPGEPAALLDHRLDSKEVAKWSFEDLDVGPGYTAALAVEVPKSA